MFLSRTQATLAMVAFGAVVGCSTPPFKGTRDAMGDSDVMGDSDLAYPNSYCENARCLFLPPTGQSLCYTDTVDAPETPCLRNSREEDCASIRFCGQDGRYADEIADRFTTLGHSVIFDSFSRLHWPAEFPYTDAKPWQLAYEDCDKLEHGGWDDWRLPTIGELAWLIDHEEAIVTMINKDAFDTVPTTDDVIWSASSNADLSGSEMWALNTLMPHFESLDPNTQRIFTCVRDDDDSLVNHLDRYKTIQITVVDQATGLTWHGAPSIQSMTFEDALSYCERSTLSGALDWRLPNINELLSIVNHGEFSPATSFPGFRSGAPNVFWSSTTLDARLAGPGGWHIENAATLDFENGQMGHVHKGDAAWALCVRGVSYRAD